MNWICKQVSNQRAVYARKAALELQETEANSHSINSDVSVPDVLVKVWIQVRRPRAAPRDRGQASSLASRGRPMTMLAQF